MDGGPTRSSEGIRGPYSTLGARDGLDLELEGVNFEDQLRVRAAQVLAVTHELHPNVVPAD
eukprot:176729-Pyramimonas_sp.AAC.1